MLKVFEFEFSRDPSYSKLVLILKKNNIIEWNTFNSRYRYLFSFNQRKKKKEKEKEESNIFSNFYYPIYNISRAETCICVCVCATRANNIVLRWYSTRDVLLRNKRREFKSMFKRSYGKKKKEKRKKRKELARKRHLRKERGVSKKTASLFVLEEVGRRIIAKKREEKREEREDFSTARKSASLLAFLPSYACSFTLANSLTLTFSLFSFSLPFYLPRFFSRKRSN